MQELKDKVAIVTGATRKRGLGRVIVLNGELGRTLILGLVQRFRRISG